MTPPEWRELDEQLRAELMMTGSLQPFEKEFFRKDGSRVPVLIGVANFEEDAHQGVAFVLDLTERKRAAEALRALQMELAHTSRLATMGQLTASIAHEVNQPIGAVATTPMQRCAFLPGNRPIWRRSGRRSTAWSGRPIEPATSFVGSASQIKKAPPRRAPFDLSEAIEEVMTLVRGELLKQHVSVQTRLTRGLPLVQGDRVQLQQVVLNLIVNAIEAMTSIDDDARELSGQHRISPAEGLLVAVGNSGRASPQRIASGFSSSFLPRSPPEWGSAFRSAAPSSRPMAGDCGPTSVSRVEPSSNSRCRCGSKPTFSGPNNKLMFSVCWFSQQQPSSNRNEPSRRAVIPRRT